MLLQVDTPIRRRPKPRLKPLDINRTDINNLPCKGSDSSTPKTPCTPLSAPAFDMENRDPFSPKIEQFSSPCGNFVEPRRPSSIRKPQKRIRSPNLDGECSPGMYCFYYSGKLSYKLVVNINICVNYYYILLGL